MTVEANEMLIICVDRTNVTTHKCHLQDGFANHDRYQKVVCTKFGLVWHKAMKLDQIQ